MRHYIRYTLKSVIACWAVLEIHSVVCRVIRNVSDDIIDYSNEETFDKTSRRAMAFAIVGTFSSLVVCWSGLGWTIKKFYKEYKASV